jgi:6-pyruvoyltetrahydropterin/6-carboxytetrahydropterin synthase
MLFITRKEHFNAAHKLYNPNWTEEKNAGVFGKCSNPNWHGHNYELYVTVKGNVNPETGFIVNLKELSTIIRTEICDKLDHKNLNLDVNFLQGVMTSTENVAIAIFNILVPHIDKLGAKLHGIKLCETENNFVEYFGN